MVRELDGIELLSCAGCGRTWARRDMLEVYMPGRMVRIHGVQAACNFVLSTLNWVGPCCASLANEVQP